MQLKSKLRITGNPLERYANWGQPLHKRFNWLAGYYLKQFGYEAHYYNERNFLWNVWNKIIDIIYALEIRCKPRFLFTSKIFHWCREFLSKFIENGQVIIRN